MWSLLLTALVLCHCSEAVRLFHLGRPRGGMLGGPGGDPITTDIKEHWYKQRLDHFNPSDTRIWHQRFFVNKSYYKAGGPVFVMIGGEGEAKPDWMFQGAWIDYAKRHSALCVLLEHRYYGKSHPTPDLSVKNLAYLSSEQALADLAKFIDHMRRRFELRPTARCIVFGGSYPGSLAAWLRAKYPHLVHAAVSTSGPLIAKPDFKEYYGVVQDDLQNQDPMCVQAVGNATQQINLLLNHRLGQQTVTKLFRLCQPVDSNNSQDVASLFETLASNFAGVVQYNKDNRQFEGAKGTNITIDVVCNVMTNSNIGPPVNRLAAVNSLLLDAYDQKCLDYKYDKMVADLRNVSWDSETAEGGRQWMYQTCTEFGFFQTSSLPPHLFGDNFPVDFFYQQCIDVFGKRFNSTFVQQATKNTNILYGGFNLQMNRILFVQGSVDPWHALGITQTLREDSPAIYINGTAHCANMYPAAPSDPPQLVNARQQVESYITKWLGR
ncbi:putative serine protease K12H4.7 isoform X2 [Anabrus simplex]